MGPACCLNKSKLLGKEETQQGEFECDQTGHKGWGQASSRRQETEIRGRYDRPEVEWAVGARAGAAGIEGVPLGSDIQTS